jgi:hypothetical protein
MIDDEGCPEESDGSKKTRDLHNDGSTEVATTDDLLLLLIDTSKVKINMTLSKASNPPFSNYMRARALTERAFQKNVVHEFFRSSPVSIPTIQFTIIHCRPITRTYESPSFFSSHCYVSNIH